MGASDFEVSGDMLVDGDLDLGIVSRIPFVLGFVSGGIY